jgi:hypothetical protein
MAFLVVTGLRAMNFSREEKLIWTQPRSRGHGHQSPAFLQGNLFAIA